jgi:hypothetical protein
MRQPAAATAFMEALQHEWRNPAGWRPSATFWRTLGRLKRLAVAFQALILAQINPGLTVADLRPIG